MYLLWNVNFVGMTLTNVSKLIFHILENQVLLVGLQTGNIVILSWNTMNPIFTIDGPTTISHQNSVVWSISNFYPGYFATGGDDGKLIIWRTAMPLKDE